VHLGKHRKLRGIHAAGEPGFQFGDTSAFGFAGTYADGGRSHWASTTLVLTGTRRLPSSGDRPSTRVPACFIAKRCRWLSGPSSEITGVRHASWGARCRRLSGNSSEYRGEVRAVAVGVSAHRQALSRVRFVFSRGIANRSQTPK